MDVKTEQYERRVQQLEKETFASENKAKDLSEKVDEVSRELAETLQTLTEL